MISVNDFDGIRLLVNSKMAALFGGAPKDFIGRPTDTSHPRTLLLIVNAFVIPSIPADPKKGI